MAPPLRTSQAAAVLELLDKEYEEACGMWLARHLMVAGKAKRKGAQLATERESDLERASNRQARALGQPRASLGQCSHKMD